MNKSELVAAIAEQAGVTQGDADSVVNAFFDVVSTTVAKGEKVQLPGWLSVERTIRSARTGRNPQTGEEIKIPETPAVKLSAGSKLKSAVKGG